jgi:hypothetical protein
MISPSIIILALLAIFIAAPLGAAMAMAIGAVVIAVGISGIVVAIGIVTTGNP